MKRKLSIILAVFLLTCLVSPARTKPDRSLIQKYSPDNVDVYNISHANRVTHECNVWMNITNYGFLGNHGPNNTDAMPDPEFPGQWAPQCEFPGGSNVQYLFSGAMWVGALIDDGDSTYARVSVGTEGWTGPARNEYELHPGEIGGWPPETCGFEETSCIPGKLNYLGNNIYSPDAVAHQELLCTYCDTLTESFWVGTDIVDGPHQPLGVKITQKMLTWSTIGYEDFIVMEFNIENIGDYDLQNLYLGFYMDADVGNIDEGSWHEDDVTGFLQEMSGTYYNLPYAADNDGRPDGVNSGNDFSCPSVAGLFTLQAPGDLLYFSYNWWIPNGSPSIDFGPSWEDDGAVANWTATYGTPNGDARKYFIMKNKEIDYDQWRTWDTNWIENHPQEFTDPFTGQLTNHDWKIEALGLGLNLSNGFDIRYLLSLGPLGENIAPPGEEPETYIYPGESHTLTVALVCGEGFHDPQNPQGDVSGDNLLDPDKYVYDDLVYNCDKALQHFLQGYQPVLPYPPNNLAITATTDDEIYLAWNSMSNLPGAGVNLYRREESGVYTDPINSTLIFDTTYVDDNLPTGTLYYYTAQSVLDDTLLSAFSPEVCFIVGAPLAPQGLSADSSADHVIYLSWDANAEPDLDHYTVYRAAEADTAFSMVGVVSATLQSMADQTVTNGVEYSYFITAVDQDNIESLPSNTVSYTAMSFDQHLLVILEYTASGPFEWVGDDLDDYYEQLFPDAGEDPDYRVIHNTGGEPFPSLTELSAYEIVWIVDDDHALNDWTYTTSKLAILQSYIANGGKVVYSGRRVFNGAFVPVTGPVPGPGMPLPDILTDYFKIESAYASNRLLGVQEIEFAAADPVHPDFPALEIDPEIVSQIVDPMGNGYLMEVDAIFSISAGEVLYNFVSGFPDSSDLHGEAVAIRYQSPTQANVMITFPLYAMQPYDSVVELVRQVLDDIDLGIEDGMAAPPAAPQRFHLAQNYPNPFNAETTIQFDLPVTSQVKLAVFDIRGCLVEELAQGRYQPGRYRVTFGQEHLASGVYFVRLQADEFIQTRKLVLLK